MQARHRAPPSRRSGPHAERPNRRFERGPRTHPTINPRNPHVSAKGLENDFVEANDYVPGASPLFDSLGLGPLTSSKQQATLGIEPAVVTLAGDVRVRSKLISWNTFSWTWIAFLLLFIIGNGGLAVVTGLDAVGIGPGLPLMDIIWHFVLFVLYGALLIYLIVQLGKETLLTDRARLPLIVGNATLFNFVMSFVFLSWILDNTSQHAEVNYSENMRAYSSFVVISGISFVWYFVVAAVALVTWLIHYNQRKTLELVDLVLSVQDEHLINLHDTSLKTLVQELRASQPAGSFIPRKGTTTTTTITNTTRMSGTRGV